MPRLRALSRVAAAITALVLAALVSGCATAYPTSQPAATRSAAPLPPSSPGSARSGQAVVREVPIPWNRPVDQQAQVEAAGLRLNPHEQKKVHYHAYLRVVVDGVRVPVPAGLGINSGSPGVVPAPGSAGIAALHTHRTDGILHVEAPAQQEFTLGQVFLEWGLKLGPGQVGAYRSGHDGQTVIVSVNGRPTTGDPAGVVLTDGQSILVEVSRAIGDELA